MLNNHAQVSYNFVQVLVEETFTTSMAADNNNELMI